MNETALTSISRANARRYNRAQKREKPLTACQLEILRRFQAGEVMHRCTHSHGFDVSYFFHGHVGANEGIRGSTVAVLEKRGLIEDFEKPECRWRGSKYRITEAR